jgi:cellulose synthase/poly-beta-1,6-N-acetylglucosamine synthase-like glycosyltransferase
MNDALPAADTPGQPAITAHTPVSVIMPVRDEQRHLEEAVGHVLAQDYTAEVEVVLAVGPSRDATGEIVRSLAAADPRVTVVANPTGLIPAANNVAIKASRHPIVARVDGHALIPPGYLRQAVATLLETGADNVGGIMAAEGVTPFEQAVAWAMTSPAGVGSARFHTGGRAGPADSVYLGVYRRAALEQVGGYDESYLRAEDWEMNHRIRQAGGLIWFQPRLRVTYRPRATVAALARQYFHYGRWRRVVARQHAGTINLRYLAPPVTLLAIAAGLAAGIDGLADRFTDHLPTLGWLMLGFLVPAFYLAGILAVTATAARRLARPALAWLPVALITMHLAWGFGFLTSPRRLRPGFTRSAYVRPGRRPGARRAPSS